MEHMIHHYSEMVTNIFIRDRALFYRSICIRRLDWIILDCWNL